MRNPLILIGSLNPETLTVEFLRLTCTAVPGWWPLHWWGGFWANTARGPAQGKSSLYWHRFVGPRAVASKWDLETLRISDTLLGGFSGVKTIFKIILWPFLLTSYPVKFVKAVWWYVNKLNAEKDTRIFFYPYIKKMCKGIKQHCAQ